MEDRGLAKQSGHGAILRVRNLVVEYPAGRRRKVHAVSDVSFDVRQGETLGVVGESGCGKSSLARAIVQLPPPTSGTIEYRDRGLTGLPSRQLRRVRPELQIIFQDPISSLNPRRRVRAIVSEPSRAWASGPPSGRGAEIARAVEQLLEAVGIDPATLGDRKPAQLSGGQCQRVSIARALMLEPKILICDEPVSALDVSVQAQILNLLRDLKARYGLTLLFISHDLAVIRNVSDRVMVMYLGKICEIGEADSVLHNAAHPYTRTLLAAAPEPSVVNKSTEGAAAGVEMPSPIDPPAGCRFHTRCPRATDLCRVEEPNMRPFGSDHFVACHFPGELPVELVERSEAGACEEAPPEPAGRWSS